MVAGAVIRVYVVPGPRVFRLIVAVLLLPLGLWLATRTLRPRSRNPQPRPSRRSITIMALAVGVVGGIYGIGGGSVLGPVLAGRGIPVTEVAPAALASTFLTSLVGAGTYALLSLTGAGHIAPDWPLGLACGFGGLAGGYVGARLQPRLPETALRLLLAALAIALAALYLTQALA
ncbi:MAG: TSUP family transporter [Streptosporangiaceae bacterium]